MIIDIPNFLNTAAAIPAVVAAEISYSPAPSVVTLISQAKATEGKAGMAGDVCAPVRRSTAGLVLRVGEASADLPATSEHMGVTGGESAATNFNSGAALGSQSTVSGQCAPPETFSNAASAAGEGHPAAVTRALGVDEQSERVIFISAFLRGAPSARDGIGPHDHIQTNCN